MHIPCLLRVRWKWDIKRIDYLHVDLWTVKQASSTNSSLHTKHCSGWLAIGWLSAICFLLLTWLLIPLREFIGIPQHTVGVNFAFWLLVGELFKLRLGLMETLTDWLLFEFIVSDRLLWLKLEDCSQLRRWPPRPCSFRICRPHSQVRPPILDTISHLPQYYKPLTLGHWAPVSVWDNLHISSNINTTSHLNTTAHLNTTSPF